MAFLEHCAALPHGVHTMLTNDSLQVSLSCQEPKRHAGPAPLPGEELDRQAKILTQIQRGTAQRHQPTQSATQGQRGTGLPHCTKIYICDAWRQEPR